MSPNLAGWSRRALRLAATALPRALVTFRGAGTRREVALTFDDGPDELLDDYLDVLDAHQARCTFFLIGGQCARRPASVLELVRRGHEVASHGYSHRLFPSMTGVQLDDEVQRTDALLPASRAPRRLIRPPQGAMSVASITRLWLFGHRTVFWSLDSDDCRTRDPEVIVERVTKGVQPGEIVLLHEAQPWTLAALPRMLSALTADGYRLVTVSDLFQ